MTKTGDDALIRYGEIVRKLSSLAARSDDASGEAFLSALQEMSNLLSEAIGEIRDPSIPHSFNEDEKRRQVVDTLRMRMISSLLLESVARDPVDSSRIESEVGTLITTSSGMTYSKVAQRCVVLLPDFETPSQIKAFGSDMIDVFDATVMSSGIVFDCSAVKNLPFVLQGILLGYKHNLKIHGKTFGMVCLRTDAIPNGSIGQVKSAFGAEQIGQYLFARPA
jgi:hypothetical protein